ncbi:PAS domain-containing sensor histidine kinase [Rhodospirillum rubrum]|uniref:sensor histidine kinase n=1 Tax=Rhodospirillum rubrum TaxID=1085 RepID=UPI0019052F0E|nr:ATP-binding protein [Rhodospirillum rubrum]MBK1663111.1 PAS domain-containing sensor histidine kinase [Rhodospirillum rubrum]MBK1675722.1 PAS domain-containing sensor histidine kinase [Rhodospirillum rubrum]
MSGESVGLALQRLYDLTRLVSDWIWETDPAGRLTYASDRVFEILGYPAQALIGRPFAELAVSGAPPFFKSDPRPFRDRRFEARHSDGSPRILLISAVPLFDPQSGDRQGWRGAAKDITQSERADAEMDRQRRFQQTLLDAIPLPVFLKDCEDRYQGCNLAFETASGHSRAEILGQRMEQVLRSDNCDRHRAEEAMVLSEGRTRVWESMEHDASGRHKLISITASPYREPGAPHVCGLIGVISDITRRQRAEDALRASVVELTASNRELQHFAEIAAHDLQEPVRAVVSHCQLLERHLGDGLDGPARDHMTFAITGARRMRDLVQDLLIYARAGRDGQFHEVVDTADLARAVVAALADEISASGATIRLGPLPSVLGRRRDLFDVMVNLFDNALKFRRPDVAPEITLEAADTLDAAGLWCFTLGDNGIGLDPVHGAQIFALFRRLHGADRYPGTGVGLAICRRIVEQHGGTIFVESDPGIGARFHFTLPAAPLEETDRLVDR